VTLARLKLATADKRKASEMEEDELDEGKQTSSEEKHTEGEQGCCQSILRYVFRLALRVVRVQMCEHNFPPP